MILTSVFSYTSISWLESRYPLMPWEFDAVGWIVAHLDTGWSLSLLEELHAKICVRHATQEPYEEIR